MPTKVAPGGMFSRSTDKSCHAENFPSLISKDLRQFSKIFSSRNRSFSPSFLPVFPCKTLSTNTFSPGAFSYSISPIYGEKNFFSAGRSCRSLCHSRPPAFSPGTIQGGSAGQPNHRRQTSGQNER